MEDSIIQLRRTLHRHPELSGRESETAGRIVQFFRRLNPDEIIEGLGGHGLAVVFSGNCTGPTVLLRCELDALPISDRNKADYRSINDGISHKCGHDGHMAILAAVGAELAARRPDRGRVVLLFQPAEENGKGAAAVVGDPRFVDIKPDFAFALHNLPGFPLGQVIIRAGAASCASRGMSIKLSGATAHAAQPETGQSPATAMCQIIQQLSSLPPGIAPENETAFATVVGATLGERAFGTSPGNAEVWATLRSETDETMTGIVDYAEQVVNQAATAHGLNVEISYEDVFQATVNSQVGVDIIQQAIGPNSLHIPDKPFRWSEDFGRIAAVTEGALFGFGAGTDIPDLHNPDYDFPEVLIPLATEFLGRVLAVCLAN